jgi:alcohol dehydrogenase YqhD (iron-dependent ADH family)
MNDYTFLSPIRLIVGKRAEEQTGSWIKKYGGTTVFVHHDSAYLKQCGLADRIIKNIRIEGLKVIDWEAWSPIRGSPSSI